jgi:hypothetical protein
MSYKPRLALTAAVAASLVAASVARAQDHAAALDERCCCDPAPEPLDDDEDPSARAAIATGATFIAVGWATSAVYGALSASITNRYLGFVPLAGPLAIATHLDPRDNISGVGALIFSVWAQAVGAMILAIGATRTHRAPRLSLTHSSSPDGALGSVSIHF